MRFAFDEDSLPLALHSDPPSLMRPGVVAGYPKTGLSWDFSRRASRGDTDAAFKFEALLRREVGHDGKGFNARHQIENAVPGGRLNAQRHIRFDE